MLTQLNISNYALIDHLEIAFDKGLTIITGETGAGKSIILGALSLILGERAEIRSIRDKSKKSVIEATFDISVYDLKFFFDENELEYYPHECILRKEFSANGRSRAFINDTPVSVAQMKELSLNLIDIHSQHNNLLISKASYQLDILDTLADGRKTLNAYKEAYDAFRCQERELKKKSEELKSCKNEEDYISFQLSQIKPLKLEKGEDIILEAEQKKLSNISEIKECLWNAENIIDGENNGCIGNLRTATKYITNASAYIDSLSDVAVRMDSALIELADISQAITSLQDNIECDPGELDRITERLNTIYSLETKYGLRNVDELISYQEELEEKIKNIDNSDEQVVALQHQVDESYKKCIAIAKKLSEKRNQVAKDVSRELCSICKPLGLKNIKFEIQFTEQDITSTGCDNVKYMMAFNKNQPLMPIEATASGGELSRLMLSIKTIMAKSMNLPTIIFDEVDTGVSGDIAAKIGEMMSEMSEKIQVIAITHLPQVAAKGDNHMKVFKTDINDTTLTSVKRLSDNERVEELAGMLSGAEVTNSAMENAKSLLYNK